MQFSKNRTLWLTLILLLAFGLRLYRSGTYGIYLDEKYTMVISQGIVMEGSNQHDVFFTPGKTYFTPAEFWSPKTIQDFIEANIRGDIGNSPAYYAVLWGWMKVFGLSDFSARFPSVLFSTLLVGLVYIFVRRHFRSESLALLSALIAAVEPFFIAYSHMARNYSFSFFLTLLATHLFLLLLERVRNQQRVGGLFVAYGLTFVLSLLSHYLTITVFLCHGIYMLLYVRKPRLWLSFSVVALIGVAVVSLWFIYGGGKYTFQTLAYQAQVYRQAALTNPYNNGFGIILPATILTVGERSLPIWADLFILSNGLGQADALGVRNLLVALGFGLAAGWLLSRYVGRTDVPGWVAPVYVALLLIGLPLYTVMKPQYVVVAALPSFAYLLYRALREDTTREQRPFLALITLLAVVPTLFLLLMSFRNGHTYGITQRYSGFSFPYTALLVALILQRMARLPIAFRVVLVGVTFLQGVLVAQLLNRIYDDSAPKYTYFGRPRGPNPHYLVAQKIRNQYAPGDTVLYPSVPLSFRDEVEKTYWPYSIQDAQLTNLYLPKDATYLQRLDTTQTDRIILVKGRTGEKITLFDLDGKTHRY